MICFFSSNSRPLYKKDIFNAMCLPDNFIIQFRYKIKYIHPDLINKIQLLKHKKGIIFFAIKSEEEGGVLKKETTNTSIRNVTIKNIEYHASTGLYHFYLELNNYSDFTIDSNTDTNNLPPNYFVSELTLKEGNENNFYERVEKIKKEFPNQLFARIDLIETACRNKIYPSYNPSQNSSIFYLKENKEYSIKIDFIHTSEVVEHSTDNISVLSIDDKAKQLHINCEEYIGVGANSDNKIYNLITRTISSRQEITYLNFKFGILENNGKLNNLTQDFYIPINITRSTITILLFGLLSILAISAITLLTLFQTSLKDNNANYLYLILSIIFAFISSSGMFMMFNKK